MTVKSLDEAINEAEKHGYEKIFVIGGENVYKDALPLAEKLYLTEVDFEIPDADAFFPEFSEEAYILESESTTQTENGITYRKKIYTKIINNVNLLKYFNIFNNYVIVNNQIII